MIILYRIIFPISKNWINDTFLYHIGELDYLAICVVTLNIKDIAFLTLKAPSYRI